MKLLYFCSTYTTFYTKLRGDQPKCKHFFPNLLHFLPLCLFVCDEFYFYFLFHRQTKHSRFGTHRIFKIINKIPNFKNDLSYCLTITNLKNFYIKAQKTELCR